MKNIKVPLAYGALFLVTYFILFMYASYSWIAQVMFILAPFILSWLVYKAINNVSADVSKDKNQVTSDV